MLALRAMTCSERVTFRSNSVFPNHVGPAIKRIGNVRLIHLLKLTVQVSNDDLQQIPQ